MCLCVCVGNVLEFIQLGLVFVFLNGIQVVSQHFCNWHRVKFAVNSCLVLASVNRTLLYSINGKPPVCFVNHVHVSWYGEGCIEKLNTILGK